MQQNLLITLKNTKGIGSHIITLIRETFGINKKNKKKINLSYINILLIKKYLRNIKISSLLQIIIKKRILNYINIKNYKGLRHKKGYPVRGQRTHTNSKTQKKLSKLNKLYVS